MASNFVCTPTTKLRRDTEILGPYAARFQFSSSIGHAPPKAVTFKSSTASLNLQVPSKKPPEKNLGAFYKKQGVGSLRDAESRREARSELERVRQKDKRSKQIMDKRKIPTKKSPTPEPRLPIAANANQNLNTKKAQPFQFNLQQKQHVVSSSDKPEISESRKLQLQRWKEQKASAEEAARKKIITKRAPVSFPVNQVQSQGQGLPNPIKPGRNANLPVTKKPPIPYGAKVDNMQQGQGIKPNERRVTRAMTKSQIPSAGSVSIKPATAKMKYLSLGGTKARNGIDEAVEDKNDKRVNPPTFISGITNTKVSESSGSDSSAVQDMEVIPETTSKEQLQMQPPTAPQEQQQPAPKKKIMGLDKYYIEYNQYLSEACTTLMSNWTLWEGKREQLKMIPEDALSEIESTLGQAKLLMNSKLPQFVQLLYFYLSKENFPGAVLPCDLQGWWDVASIQVEKVKDRFNELAKREANNWQPVLESRPRSFPPLSNTKTNKLGKASESRMSDGSTENSAVPNLKPVKPKPVQASSGLRQFLANKRKNAAPVDSVSGSEVVKVSNSDVGEVLISTRSRLSSKAVTQGQGEPMNLPSTPKNNDDYSATRQFEGGFFQVTSPLRAVNTRSRASVRRTLTPSAKVYETSSPRPRRASVGQNSLLATLAVRKSMGPIFKIGADIQRMED